jgi:uncharacterized protein
MALVGLPTLAQAAPATTPFISEFHYDNTGTDSGEFVEVTLPPGTTSAGLSIVRYNGGNGAVYTSPTAPALPVVTAPADASAVAVIDYPVDGLQNGAPDGLALVRNGTEVLEFISYEGAMTATGGPGHVAGDTAASTSTDVGVSETNSTPIGQSLSKVYDTTKGTYAWTGPAASTKGQVNPDVTPEPPPPPSNPCAAAPTHEIGAVQGDGAESPLVGKQVTVRGVVVGDVPGFSGFYLQDADGDGRAATSDGVFVYSPGTEVALGDTVAVEGAVSEFGGLTEITSRTDVEVCTPGTEADLPDAAPLDLPADDAARERLEGMLVVPADTLTVSEIFDLTSFGELTLS